MWQRLDHNSYASQHHQIIWSKISLKNIWTYLIWTFGVLVQLLLNQQQAQQNSVDLSSSKHNPYFTKHKLKCAEQKIRMGLVIGLTWKHRHGHCPLFSVACGYYTNRTRLWPLSFSLWSITVTNTPC